MKLEYDSKVKEHLNNHPGEAIIKVIGIGGGGCNAVKNMIKSGLDSVEFVSANTDYQSLIHSGAPTKIQLGVSLTKGLGAGADPEIGRKAALENREEIKKALENSSMLFIATGMGGGTGSGASPVIAEIARELGILTVAVVTKPFDYEGKRMDVAEQGIELLKEFVDSIIIIPNQKLLTVLGEEVSLREAFQMADDVLCTAITGIYDVIQKTGLLNLDFNDIKNVMGKKGIAMMGSAQDSGNDRAKKAAEKAITNPLLDNISLDGAKGVLVNITTAPGKLRLSETEQVMQIIRAHVDQDVESKVGFVEDENMDENDLRVTIIATDLNPNKSYIDSKAEVGTIHDDSDNDEYPSIAKLIRSGRNSKSVKLTAKDFLDKSLVDDIEIPTIFRNDVED